jgi:hypothetical protein
MTHAALTPYIGRDFDSFLFASIGEDRHGNLLSVISALARSDLDPWQEAVDLARMSRDMATARLSALIAALPGPPTSNRPVETIAGELVALLPSTDRSAPLPPRVEISDNLRYGLALGALAFLVAFSLAIATHPTAPWAPGASPPAFRESGPTQPSPPGGDHRL